MAEERPSYLDDPSLKRMIRSVLWTEMMQRNQLQPPSFMSRRGRAHPNQAIAGIQLAVVTDEAAPSTHTKGTEYYKIAAEDADRGKAILLSQLGDAGSLLAEWESLSDPDGTGTELSLDDIKFWVVSVYDNVPLQVGKLIRVYNVPPPEYSYQTGRNYEGGFGGRVQSGSTVYSGDGESGGTDVGVYVDKTPALGEYVSPDDYHRAKDTYDAGSAQVLFHEAQVGTGEEDQPIIWGGDECPAGTGTGT